MDCEALLAAGLDPNAFMPCDGVTNSGLRTRGRDYYGIAECSRCTLQSRQTGCVNAVVVGHKEFHFRWRKLDVCSRRLGLILRRHGWSCCVVESTIEPLQHDWFGEDSKSA